ncbi:SDR family oxidoreductase [Candidatus Bathyarchaeota archaeon]|nr:SDR family oxidoreductase [Candidatus Bathyarchaeota archaeon]
MDPNGSCVGPYPINREKTEKTPEAVLAEWIAHIPLKRLARPDESANFVVFAASEKASYLTGSVIQIDGGFIKALI